MAILGAQTTTEEVRTEGKSWGPVTQNITYAGLLATVLVFVLGAFGVVVPPEVALAFATLVFAGIGYLTKGRKVIETTHVIDPIPDGNGAHRAETIEGDTNV